MKTSSRSTLISCSCSTHMYEGVVDNKHWTDVESPPSPPRLCMSGYPEGKSCSDLVRELVRDDPAAGWCSHRAWLFKFLADRLLPHSCKLVRGNYNAIGRGGFGFGDGEEDGGGHAWNVVAIHGKPYLVDPMLHPGQLLEAGWSKLKPVLT